MKHSALTALDELGLIPVMGKTDKTQRERISLYLVKLLASVIKMMKFIRHDRQYSTYNR